MPIYRLSKEVGFPNPRLANPEGILAIGGDLSPQRLLLAYAMGIFPWYSKRSPILWWSPDPRMVLYPEELYVNRSLRKVIRRGQYEIRVDTAFEEVIKHCATKKRPDQKGTWITRNMKHAYIELYRLGFAHSIESWENDKLVGGIYGVSLGGAFFGESMYTDRPDASKVSFVSLVETIKTWGFTLVDCQVHTEHLERFGAKEVPREEFLQRLQQALEKPTRKGFWRF